MGAESRKNSNSWLKEAEILGAARDDTFAIKEFAVFTHLSFVQQDERTIQWVWIEYCDNKIHSIFRLQ